MKQIIKLIVAIIVFASCTQNYKKNESITQSQKWKNRYNVLLEHVFASIKNENINVSRLENILDVEDRGILILRVKGGFCQSCLDSTFSILTEMIDTKHFFVLATDFPDRYLKYKFKENYKIINNDLIDIPIENTNTMPYLFYYDKDKQTKHVFFIDKLSVKFFRKYCETINALYYP